MAQAAVPAANAIAADGFIEYSEYNGYTIIVPKQFPPDDSKLLMQLQVLAIDAHAVSRVERDTIVNTAAWTTEGQPCVHINFCPVLRDAFDYSVFLPLSLVEKCGHVVAGVCVTSLGQCKQLCQRVKFLPLSVDNSLGLLLKGLWPRSKTNLNHNRRQDTSNRSRSTTTMEVNREGSVTTKRSRQRDNSKQDEHNAILQAPKRMCIAGGPIMNPPIIEPFETTITPFPQSIEPGDALSPTLAFQDYRTNLVPVVIPTQSNLGQLPIMPEGPLAQITWPSALPTSDQIIANLASNETIQPGIKEQSLGSMSYLYFAD